MKETAIFQNLDLKITAYSFTPFVRAFASRGIHIRFQAHQDILETSTPLSLTLTYAAKPPFSSGAFPPRYFHSKIPLSVLRGSTYHIYFEHFKVFDDNLREALLEAFCCLEGSFEYTYVNPDGAEMKELIVNGISTSKVHLSTPTTAFDETQPNAYVDLNYYLALLTSTLKDETLDAETKALRIAEYEEKLSDIVDTHYTN